MTQTRKLLQAALCASTLALGAAGFAPSAWAQPAAPRVESAAQRLMSIRDVYDALEKQGYRNFTEIELERGKRRGSEYYDVKADNADGNYVKLHVDAVDGSILEERTRRDSRRR